MNVFTQNPNSSTVKATGNYTNNGYEFKPTKDITVSALRIFMRDLSGSTTGVSYTVQLWQVSPATILRTCVITWTSGVDSYNFWKPGSVTPITLTANTNYAITFVGKGYLAYVSGFPLTCVSGGPITFNAVTPYVQTRIYSNATLSTATNTLPSVTANTYLYNIADIEFTLAASPYSYVMIQ